MLTDIPAHRFTVQFSPLNALNLPDETFDLVFCRGAFFFFDPDHQFLREIDRVIRPEGFAFIGGGFGSHTSSNVIDAISDESRRLNYELGKKIDIGVDKRAEIVDKGGLWVVIRK